MDPRLLPAHGSREPATGARVFVVVTHAVALGLSGWMLVGAHGAAPRRLALLACAALYFARTCGTLLYLLERSVRWTEAVAIAATLSLVQVLFAACGGSAAAGLGPGDWAALALYGAGSCLNTGSELGRLRWKSRPENAGRLYTGGLFSLSRHVNYFGDALLFTGWALLTRNPWCLLAPAAMSAGFVFVNIPALERHLRARYGSQFEDYEARTKSFVPFLF